MRFPKTNSWAVGCNGGLTDGRNRGDLISKRECGSVNFGDSPLRQDGTSVDIENDLRNIQTSDWRNRTMDGNPNVPAETDCLSYMGAPSSNNTSYYYNQLASQSVGNYENRPFAHPVKDGGLTMYRKASRLLGNLVDPRLAAKIWARHPSTWRYVYPWCFLGPKRSAATLMCILPFSDDDDSAASSRS